MWLLLLYTSLTIRRSRFHRILNRATMLSFLSKVICIQREVLQTKRQDNINEPHSSLFSGISVYAICTLLFLYLNHMYLWWARTNSLWYLYLWTAHNSFQRRASSLFIASFEMGCLNKNSDSLSPTIAQLSRYWPHKSRTCFINRIPERKWGGKQNI